MKLERSHARRRTIGQAIALLTRLSPGFLREANDPNWRAWTEEILGLRKCCKDRVASSMAPQGIKQEFVRAYHAYYERYWIEGYRLSSDQQRQILCTEMLELIKTIRLLNSCGATAAAGPTSPSGIKHT